MVPSNQQGNDPMQDKSTTIDGYTIELCWFDENSNSCHVSRTIGGTRYCSSLSAISDGVDEFTEEANKPISDTTVHKIEAWALANGY
jgi:hypothetical protein